MNLVYDYQINIKSTKAHVQQNSQSKIRDQPDKNAILLASIVNDIF